MPPKLLPGAAGCRFCDTSTACSELFPCKHRSLPASLPYKHGYPPCPFRVSTAGPGPFRASTAAGIRLRVSAAPPAAPARPLLPAARPAAALSAWPDTHTSDPSARGAGGCGGVPCEAGHRRFVPVTEAPVEGGCTSGTDGKGRKRCSTTETRLGTVPRHRPPVPSRCLASTNEW